MEQGHEREDGSEDAEAFAQRREQMLESWQRAAAGWGRRADEVRDHGMPVSAWMIEHLDLQPGQRIVELAAGPGDTGFLAAELVKPGGTLISSDASEAMLALARERAAAQGIDNVEFRRLELEWLDLPTASVDALLCRWGIMLCTDPLAALRECRRVLASGGRLAAAVWDEAPRNPWATIPPGALIRLGHLAPPDPGAPGMFALAAPGRLETAMADAGFVEITVEPISVLRRYRSVDAWLEEVLDLSMIFAGAWEELDAAQRAEVHQAIVQAAAPFTGADGRVDLPGSSLAVLGHA